MKSKLKFFQFDSNRPSNCGKVLEIEISNAELGWQGVVLEKGYSPSFYPKNVYTPYFYFALALERDLYWKVKISDDMQFLKTTPGEIWINPPKTPFSHEISEPCFFIILAVEESVFLQATNLSLTIPKLKFLNNYNVHDETLKNIIELFLMEVQSGGKNGFAYYQNLLSLLSTHYINNYSNHQDLQSDSFNTSKIRQPEIDKIDRFISDNMDRNISIDELAERLNYSKYYFLREFKKSTGVTPYQYLIERKMRAARKRLSQSDQTIAAVSYDLGFNDQAYFTHVFKKHFGKTPGQFQKSLSSENPE